MHFPPLTPSVGGGYVRPSSSATDTHSARVIPRPPGGVAGSGGGYASSARGVSSGMSNHTTSAINFNGSVSTHPFSRSDSHWLLSANAPAGEQHPAGSALGTSYNPSHSNGGGGGGFTSRAGSTIHFHRPSSSTIAGGGGGNTNAPLGESMSGLLSGSHPDHSPAGGGGGVDQQSSPLLASPRARGRSELLGSAQKKKGRGSSASPTATFKNAAVGSFHHHTPAGPPPRSLITQRIVDVESATAPITVASSHRSLLGRDYNQQASIQFQSEPHKLNVYNSVATNTATDTDAQPAVSSVSSTNYFSGYVSGGDAAMLRNSLTTSSTNNGGLAGGRMTAPNSPSRNGSGGGNLVGPGSGNSPDSNASASRRRQRALDEAAADSGTLFRPSGRNCVRAALSGRDCDAVEVAASVFGPALANLSTAQTLNTLERECHVAQHEERFIDAQICNDLLNQVAHNCADKAQRAVQDKIRKLQPVQAKHEENREELIQFTKLWEKELSAYDAKGEAAITALKQKHQRLLHERSQLLEHQLANTKPHYSRRVIDLRIELAKLLPLKQFREADGVNKDLVALEKREQERFQQTLTKKYQKGIKAVAAAHQLELETLKGRIAAGREELLGQRRQDYQTLIQRHFIRVGEVDHKARAQLQQEHKHLQRQAVLMARRPANAVDLFSEYDEQKKQQALQMQQHMASQRHPMR